jgi:DNA invertase Pin-like site-specific DNA recombinase
MSALAVYARPLRHLSEAQQLAMLHAWAATAGHEVVREFIEPERKRGADRKQEQARMLAEATRGTFDRVACVSLLALARSCVNAAEVLSSLHALGIPLTVLAEGIDTATDDGRTARAFALAGQLEQACHAERASVGFHKRAEAGLPVGRPRVPATIERRIVVLLQAGTSVERITRLVGCGKSTVYRCRDELQLPARSAP